MIWRRPFSICTRIGMLQCATPCGPLRRAAHRVSLSLVSQTGVPRYQTREHCTSSCLACLLDDAPEPVLSQSAFFSPTNQGFDFRGDVKVFDFGLCKSLSAKLKAREGYGYRLTGRAGSLPYMAVSVAFQPIDTVFSSNLCLIYLVVLRRRFHSRRFVDRSNCPQTRSFSTPTDSQFFVAVRFLGCTNGNLFRVLVRV